ncbi:MAG: PIN domain-containing protein [Candidatus Xenobia bacterium]
MKLYLETSVPNFLFVHDAPDKRRHTEQLFEEIQAGRHEAFVSDLYTQEVRATESPLRRAQLEAVPSVYSIGMLQTSLAAYDLLDKYVDAKAFTSNNDVDGLHVAVATLAACEVVVSWNMNHIVRAWTIKRVLEVNHREGLAEIVICTPEEVIDRGGTA